MAGYATANCTICPLNSFSAGGAANDTLECSPCPEATVTFSAGAKAATDCVGETCIWLFAAEQVWAWWLATSLAITFKRQTMYSYVSCFLLAVVLGFSMH